MSRTAATCRAARRGHAFPGRALEGGFSLVELMVASTIGMFLIGGILAIYANGHASFELNQRIAKLQDNARVAIDIIAPDLRLAGYWSLVISPSSIAGRTGDAISPLPAVFTPANDCYAGFYTNVTVSLEFANEDQNGAANPFNACIPDTARQAGTDIVVVRRAASDQTPLGLLVPGQLYLIANRIAGALFVGGQPLPAGFTATDQIHAVITHAYYVSPTSSTRPGLPSLRRMTLAPGPQITDEELVPGVEDLQVQFGVDADADEAVDSYFSPGAAALAGASIVSARLWVMTRSDGFEDGFKDVSTYDYSDISVSPNDGTRRLMLSKTVHLRNGRSSL